MVPAGHGPEECIFCPIIARRAPAYLFYEDPTAVAFLDIFPFTRGHALVVPRRHVDRLTDLKDDEPGKLLASVAAVCRRMERLSRDYNISLNQGALAGQIVFHLHFHVIPRYDRRNPFNSTSRPPLEQREALELVGLLGAE
ncbi:MAG: HIT family protein [Thermoplasmata archaeon]|nr:HIT family protein [Thermoplasmata archaeon]MCI4344585.1 HIT family protein [Thermoplasmata archaeon]